jgi:Uma2 family endonuclease
LSEGRKVGRSDQKIFYYPGLVLSSDPEDREDYFVRRPCLIIEVLSEATERIDRREKMLAYQTIPSLKECLLVAQGEPHVEAYRRRNDWRPEVVAEGEVSLECLDVLLPVDGIYEDVFRA